MRPTIKKVETKKELRQFIDFQFDLYENDPAFVTDLFTNIKNKLSRKKNPFFQHSEADYFLALDDNGKVVGRIAAIKNNNYIKYTGEKIGFFGFFDFINDYDVVEALLQTAADWVKDKGLEGFNGPMNFSTNDTVGTLIEGFEKPPYIEMTHNFPYYNDLMEQFGLKKKTDLLAYEIQKEGFPDRLSRAKNLLERRFKQKGITIRTLNMKDFANETKKILGVYNESWQDNLGFVPMTDAEFLHMTKDMKQIVDPDFIYMAEQGGKLVGVSLTLPDVNQAFIKLKKGRLFPFGIFKLLAGLKKINRVRILAMGVIPSARRHGIDAYFYLKSFETASKKNMISGEASWILEDNPLMNQAIIKMNGKVHKKYRIYEMMFS